MKRIERLTLTDLTNLAVECPDMPMHQGGMGVIDGHGLLDAYGNVDIDRVRAHFAARLDRVPLLRRTLWRTRPFEGRPLWVDDPEFRIDDHVLLARLPDPGGEAAAIDFAEQRMATLMDRRRPLWQLWLLEGYGGGRIGVFLKLHHVLADGGAILNIIALLFDLEPGVTETSPSAWIPQRPPTRGELVLDNLATKSESVGRALGRLAHPAALLTSARATWRGMTAAARAGRHAPRTSLNGPVGPRRAIGVLPLELAEVKSVAHDHGVKVNDVFLDLIAAGIRHLLEVRGETTRGIVLHASIAARLPGADRSALGGNHAGTMVVPLPLDDDGGMRLVEIGRATARAKREQRAAVPQSLMALLALTGLTRFFIRRQGMVNVLVTDLAGPQFPMYVAGGKLLDAFAITPVSGNVTASFAALSYNGRFNISVDADARSWPDLYALISGMAAGWRRLRVSAAA